MPPLSRETLVGELRVRRRGSYVLPHGGPPGEWVEIPPGWEHPHSAGASRIKAAHREETYAELDGTIVEVEILTPAAGRRRARGRVIEVLGRPDDFGIDVEIIIRKYGLPHRFPAAVLDQAALVPATIPAAELARRQDFRRLDVVTIDGDDARDFDDAVWVDLLPNGHFALHVHIADVSYFVRPNSPIDREAALRGTSVYFPDRAVPMLPLELTTDLCSLKPQADRLVLSVLLEIDRRGDVISQHFTRGIIRSAERLTYTNVHLALEGDEGLRRRYATLMPRLELMRELAEILNRRRMERGSIDFDLPEPLIEFDEWGQMVGVSRAPRNIAHRIIEEFMLAANEAVASHLEAAGVPSIYRIHEPPDPMRVMEFEQVAARFGYSLGLGPLAIKRFSQLIRKRDGRKLRKDLEWPDDVKITSRHYQNLIRAIEGRPEQRILNYMMLRSLKQARYSEQNKGHFALATKCYTHFTSPIRRYPDLIVHRILSLLLDSKQPGVADLEAIAAQASLAERRAAEAERELVEWKKMKFMIDKVGEEFDGLIVAVERFGFFVELADLFVEGLVPIETLPGDRYSWRENERRIVGERSRLSFAIGDTVRVRLDRVNAVEGKLQFSYAGPRPWRRR